MSPSCFPDQLSGSSFPGFSHIPPGLAFDKFTCVYSVTDETVEVVIARDAARGLRVWAVSLWVVREKLLLSRGSRC